MTSRIRLVMEGCVMAGAGRKISNAATSASTSSRLRVSWVGGVMRAAYRIAPDGDDVSRLLNRKRERTGHGRQWVAIALARSELDLTAHDEAFGEPAYHESRRGDR